MSLPSWERGLKLKCIKIACVSHLSLPSWERGLKFLGHIKRGLYVLSLPSWERGLKYNSICNRRNGRCVAPLVGAWIEIGWNPGSEPEPPSLPSWERGLKW